MLYIRAVEYARRHGVLIHARSTFSPNVGTYVLGPGMTLPDGEGEEMEEPIVAGVATDLGQAKITVIGVPDVPGKAAEIFKIVAKSGANVDMIVQNVSAAATGRTDISFTLPKGDAATALKALAGDQSEVGFESLVHDDQIGKLSVVGAGMRTHSGVSATLFEALSIAGINIEMISTSEIRISVVVRGDDLAEAARVVHRAYDLDGDADATVHAGIGSLGRLGPSAPGLGDVRPGRPLGPGREYRVPQGVGDGALRAGGLRDDLVPRVEHHYAVLGRFEALVPADLVDDEQIDALARALAARAIEQLGVIRRRLGGESHDRLTVAPVGGEAGQDVLVLDELERPRGRPSSLLSLRSATSATR